MRAACKAMPGGVVLPDAPLPIGSSTSLAIERSASTDPVTRPTVEDQTMIKRLLAIAVLGAALVACTPSDGGTSPDVDPSLAVPTDVLPTDDMMSAAPSESP
jgi:hypothetical protein